MRITTEQREERFIAHYLRTLDAQASAIEAGYSPKTAKQIGSKLLTKPRVAEAVRAKQAAQIVVADMDATRIKQEIYALATLDPGELFDAAGSAIQIKQLPKHVRACIKRVSVTVDAAGTSRSQIEFWDKPTALTLAAKHLALLAPVEVNHNVRFPFATLTDEELRQKMLLAAKER